MKKIGKGYIKYIRHSGSVRDIAQSAAISYDKADAGWTDTKCQTVVMSLLTKEHMSPFEHATVTFEVFAPIFVLRQWMRHRIGWSYSEQSLRYITPKEFVFYTPEAIDEIWSREEYDESLVVRHKTAYRIHYETLCKEAVGLYQQMLVDGIPREQARAVLPVGLYSKVMMTVNLRALFHFVNLRSDKHAQPEIQKFSDALREMCREIPDFYPIFGGEE